VIVTARGRRGGRVRGAMPCRSRSPLLRFHLHPARLSDLIDLDATGTSGAAAPRRHRALPGAL